jgi:ferredoxin-NADP reductase
MNTAGLIAQHEPPGAAAHLVILAGVAVTALVVIGVSRWRRRRSRPRQHASSHDRSEESTRSREPRRVDAEMLAEVAPSPAERPHVYACGPTPFVEAVAEALVQLGHDPSAIKTERFGPTGR